MRRCALRAAGFFSKTLMLFGTNTKKGRSCALSIARTSQTLLSDGRYFKWGTRLVVASVNIVSECHGLQTKRGGVANVTTEKRRVVLPVTQFLSVAVVKLRIPDVKPLQNTRAVSRIHAGEFSELHSPSRSWTSLDAEEKNVS